ncbi:MAG: ATP-binding protein [Peptococcaceae bacterium]|nr:ATP-binding protein [Peptococcaceae bacterium]
MFRRKRLLEPDRYRQTALLDNLAPPAFEFGKGQLVFGDQLGRILIVTAYPPRVGPAWLSYIAGMQGVVCSIHVTPTDPSRLVEQINRSIGELADKAENARGALAQQRAEQGLKDAQELLRKIDQEQQQVFYLSLVLLILAPDQETLDRRCRRVQAALAAKGMRGRQATFRQETGLKAVGPWALLPDDILAAAKRNMPAETVAAAFPFAASSINDGQGVLLGRDADGGLVLIDTWKRRGDRTNSNWTILGKPGAGKSYTVRMMALRELAQGAKIIIIDPEREYKGMCKQLRGNWVNCAGGAGGRINPLEVRPLAPDPEVDGGEEDDPDIRELQQARAQGALAHHLQLLKTFFRTYLPELTDIERVALQKALREVYSAAGITWETDPLTVSAAQWPTFSTLHACVAEKAKKDPGTWQRLALFLEEAVHGADAVLWDGPTTVRADADLTVLDVHELQNTDDTVRRAQYFNVLTWAWHKIEEDRRQKTLLLVDEAWLLIDKKTPQTLAFLREVSKRVRKYMGGLWVISQNVVDFTHESIALHGQALLNNPCYKLLLAQGEKDLEVLEQLMHLSEAEQELLTRAKRGEALLVAGSQRINVRIEAAPFEKPLLTGGGT